MIELDGQYSILIFVKFGFQYFHMVKAHELNIAACAQRSHTRFFLRVLFLRCRREKRNRKGKSNSRVLFKQLICKVFPQKSFLILSGAGIWRVLVEEIMEHGLTEWIHHGVDITVPIIFNTMEIRVSYLLLCWKVIHLNVSSMTYSVFNSHLKYNFPSGIKASLQISESKYVPQRPVLHFSLLIWWRYKVGTGWTRVHSYLMSNSNIIHIQVHNSIKLMLICLNLENHSSAPLYIHIFHP